MPTAAASQVSASPLRSTNCEPPSPLAGTLKRAGSCSAPPSSSRHTQLSTFFAFFGTLPEMYSTFGLGVKSPLALPVGMRHSKSTSVKRPTSDFFTFAGGLARCCCSSCWACASAWPVPAAAAAADLVSAAFCPSAGAALAGARGAAAAAVLGALWGWRAKAASSSLSTSSVKAPSMPGSNVLGTMM